MLRVPAGLDPVFLMMYRNSITTVYTLVIDNQYSFKGPSGGILTLLGSRGGGAVMCREQRVCEADRDYLFQHFMNRRGVQQWEPLNRRGPQNDDQMNPWGPDPGGGGGRKMGKWGSPPCPNFGWEWGV